LGNLSLSLANLVAILVGHSYLHRCLAFPLAVMADVFLKAELRTLNPVHSDTIYILRSLRPSLNLPIDTPHTAIAPYTHIRRRSFPSSNPRTTTSAAIAQLTYNLLHQKHHAATTRVQRRIHNALSKPQAPTTHDPPPNRAVSAGKTHKRLALPASRMGIRVKTRALHSVNIHVPAVLAGSQSDTLRALHEAWAAAGDDGADRGDACSTPRVTYLDMQTKAWHRCIDYGAVLTRAELCWWRPVCLRLYPEIALSSASERWI